MDPTGFVARMEPPGPAGACHRAGQRPDPVGRPDDKLRVMRGQPSQRHVLPRITLRYIRATAAEPMDRQPNAWQCAPIPSLIRISAARAGGESEQAERSPKKCTGSNDSIW